MSAVRDERSLRAMRWNAVLRIARQEARDALLGWSLYAGAAIALAIATVLVVNSVRFVGETGLNIVSRPFLLPMQAAAMVALLFVTLGAALAIARPREQGSLQILFFAPIDGPVFIFAHFLAGIAIFGLFMLLLLPPLLLLVWVTNFVLPPALIWGLLPAALAAGLGTAFGLFVSAAAPSGRAAVIILVGVILLLLALQAAHAALVVVPATSRFYDALLFLRGVVRLIQDTLLYFSPFHLLEAMLASALRLDLGALLGHMLVALVGTGVWLVAAIWALDRRGVLP